MKKRRPVLAVFGSIQWSGLLLSALTVLLLNGCALSTQAVLQKGLDSGDGILVFRKPPEETRWINSYGFHRFSTSDAREVGEGYVAIAVKPGTYFMDQARSHLSIRGFESRYPKVVKSVPGREVFGKVTLRDGLNGVGRVIKTPELEQEYDFEEEEWVTTSILSWYILSYDFNAHGRAGDNLAGSVSILPGEILLIPSVWAEVELEDSPCSVVSQERGSGLLLFDVLEVIVRPFGTNGEYTWEWDCLVSSLTYCLSPADLEDFRNRADPVKLPPGALEKIREGVLVPGSILDLAPAQIENDGTRRYLFRKRG